MNDLYMPFEREYSVSLEEAVDMRMHGRPLYPPANCSSAFANIILHACAFERNDRYQSIDEMIRDLKRLEIVPPRPFGKSAYEDAADNLKDDAHGFYDMPEYMPMPKRDQKYARAIVKRAFNPVPLIAVILSLIAAGVMGIAIYKFIISGEAISYAKHPITEIMPNITAIGIDIKEKLEITEVECPDVIYADKLEPMFGYKYSTELISSNSDLVLTVNNGADDELSWNAPEGLSVSADYLGNKYYITIDATDLYGAGNQKCYVDFLNNDGTAKCTIEVDIRNTGPFKEDMRLSSSDEEILSFNENNKFILSGTGTVTVYWMYGGELKYSKEVKVVKSKKDRQ
jgi:hypothetical protein